MHHKEVVEIDRLGSDSTKVQPRKSPNKALIVGPKDTNLSHEILHCAPRPYLPAATHNHMLTSVRPQKSISPLFFSFPVGKTEPTLVTEIEI
jgi:hypothetical protein